MVKKWWGRLLRGGHCDSVFWMEYYEPDMRVSFIVAIARATLFPVGCRGSGKGSKNSERGVSFLYVLNGELKATVRKRHTLTSSPTFL